MKTRLVLAGLAFVASAATAMAVLRRPPTGGASGPDAHPLRPGIFDTLIVEKDGARTTLRKRGDAFWVTAPVAYAADPTAAAAAFQAIEKLHPGAIVTTRAQRHAELEVEVPGAGGESEGKGKGKGIVLAIARGDQPRLALVVGKAVGAGTMIRLRTPGGADPVWQVNGDLRAIFDKLPAEWRDRSVTTFPAEQARELAITARAGAQIVLRRGDDEAAAADAQADVHAGAPPGARGDANPWRVIRSSEEIATLDDPTPNEIITTLAALKASDFADTATKATAGLDAPSMTVSVTLRSGEKDVLLIGDDAGDDDAFAMTGESPQIFRIKRFNIERIARRPIQFRRRVLCDLPDGEIRAIDVAHGADSFALIKDGPAWRAIAPRGLKIDPDKVAAFASIFRGWRAPRIAEDARDRADFGAATVVITGRTKSARCTVVATRHPSQIDTYLAKVPPAREVFVLPGWMIDRVAVPLDQIRAR